MALSATRKPVIRTPDQRLRVFVSSTLQELAEERAAVREAITRLHLSPVMFELGARPHPPRALYRAYLEQSHIFVGIYWQRYGWVAPGEEVSGLEDEYRLSGDRPKLIYVKTPAPERDARLKDLLRGIQNDDTASYKPFTTARELRKLLADDLALLLSERFEAAVSAPVQTPLPASTEPTATANALPVPPTPLVGRERELGELAGLLHRREVRLVTLLGPGGIGKSRLALELGHTLKEQFADGVIFVPLAPLRDAELVPEMVARSLGLRVGGASVLEGLKAFLHDKQLLLVLDNFEQVAAAAEGISALLAAAPRLVVLVTSREVLHLSGEHVYPVPPLSLVSAKPTATDLAEQSEAVRLFVARARAVKPGFNLSPENIPVVAEIMRKLEGLPLAIELAASRLRLLTLPALLERLSHRFELLRGGARDLPRRQQTLQNTIDWSYDLLMEREQALFVRLGVFAGGWSLEAAEALSQNLDGDVLEGLASLLDKSFIHERDEGNEPRYSMLETLREYALAKLTASGQEEAVRRLHADYFTDHAERSKSQLHGPDQASVLQKLGREHDNVRAVMRWALDRRELAYVTRLSWALWAMWWAAAHTDEGHRWLQEALAEKQPAALGKEHRAKLLGAAGIMAFWQGAYELAAPLLDESLPLFREIGDQAGEAYVLLALGANATSQGEVTQAQAWLERSLELFRVRHDDWGAGLAHSGLGRNAIRQGDLEQATAIFKVSERVARERGDWLTLVIVLSGSAAVALKQKEELRATALFQESLEISRQLGYLEGIARSLEGLAVAAALGQDFGRAARLLAAAEALRLALHFPSWSPETKALAEGTKTMLRTTLSKEDLAAAWVEGQALGLEGTVAYALTGPASSLPPGIPGVEMSRTAEPGYRPRSGLDRADGGFGSAA